MVYLIVIPLLVLTVLMCLQESKKRKIGFIPAFLISLIVTPLFGYFIISARPLRNPRGCEWCGNSKNEAQYCGVCHKNVTGDVRET